MPIHLYRGDTRNPQAIHGAHGFQGWINIPAATARLVAARFLNAPANPAIALPGGPGHHLFSDFVMGAGNKNLQDLITWIKATRIRGETPQVSTDEGEQCGGYADGATVHVYQMTFTLFRQAGGVGAITPVAAVANLQSNVRPWLVFDNHAGVAASNIIGVARGGAGLVEVAFLTAIPYAMITGVKSPPYGAVPPPGAFVAMP